MEMTLAYEPDIDLGCTMSSDVLVTSGLHRGIILVRNTVVAVGTRGFG